MTSKTPKLAKSWQTRLSSFAEPPSSRDELRVGHVLYLSHAADSDPSINTRSRVSSMLGILESPEVNHELSRKISYWRGKETTVCRKRWEQDKVDKFLNSLFTLSSEVEAAAIPSPSNTPARVFASPQPPISISSPLAATSSTILNHSSDLSTASTSKLSPSIPSSSLNCSSLSSPSPLTPSSLHSSSLDHSDLSSPSSSQSVSPPSSFSLPHLSISPTHSSDEWSLSPSSFSPTLDPSPSKSARMSFPVSTPSRGQGSRPGFSPQSCSRGMCFHRHTPDYSGYWKQKLAEKGRLIDAHRKQKHSYAKDLKIALKHLGVSSVRELPKVGEYKAPEDSERAKELKKLKRKLRQLNPLTDPVAPGVFVTKTSEGFIQAVKYCSLRLTALGVADGKQGAVMNVVSQMLDVRLSHVPSKTAFGSWVPALVALNRMHAAEMLDKSEGGLTLLRDETTKRGDKIQQHAVTIASNHVLFLGCTPVNSKCAIVSFDALRAKVEYLAKFSSSSSPSKLFHSFIIKIKNLMSDRASTETLFNKIFKSVRDRFLELKEGWESLSPEEQETAQSLCIHFCQLHSISNLQGVVSSELVEHECEHRHHQVDSSSAGFARVIKEVPRYLGARSSGGHREHKEWVEWSKQVGVHYINIPSLLGHRFMIYFVIGARIFCLRDSILEFIEYAPPMAFLKDLLKDELVIVQLQILGLLDQKLTGPLWRVAENLGFVEAGQYHRDFLVFIDACIDEPALFFSSQFPTLTIPPRFDLFKEDGPLMQSLVTTTPSPLARKVSLRVLRACATYLRDVLSQSLDEGVYSNPSDSVAQCVKSAPTTNRAVESGFAYLDYLYHRAPYMRFFRRDAIMCFVLNHVAEWLDGKSTRERTLILENALACREEIVRDERKKTEQLGEELVRKMEERKVEDDGKAQKNEVRKSRISQDLSVTGLLTTEAEIDYAVFGLGHSDAINLIKAQLRFRKKVLEQQADPRLYRFSAGGRNHNLDTLVSHLKELVSAHFTSGTIEDEDFRASFVGRICEIPGEIELPDGTVISGNHSVDNISIDHSGQSMIYLSGSSGIVFMSRVSFEDLINDGSIYPL